SDQTARANISKDREESISLHDPNPCRIAFPPQDCSVRSKARSWTDRAGSAKRDDDRFQIGGWSEPDALDLRRLRVVLPVVVEYLHSGLVVKFQGGIGQRISHTERPERGTDPAEVHRPICHHQTADERVISGPDRRPRREVS